MGRTVAIAAGITALAGTMRTQVTQAQEASEPKGIAACRIAVMRTLGARMMALKTILTDQTQLMDRVVWHGQVIRDASKWIPDLFPEGGDQRPSRALPSVWKKRAAFDASARKPRELSAAFLETTKEGDPKATLKAFVSMGKEGCKGCHQDFRKRKEEG